MYGYSHNTHYHYGHFGRILHADIIYQYNFEHRMYTPIAVVVVVMVVVVVVVVAVVVVVLVVVEV